MPLKLWHYNKFQSTLPLRGATCFDAGHADGAPNFNPRSPYGERLHVLFSGGNINGFQSTLPLRGATGAGGKRPYVEKISIHAPLTGSDT